MRIAFASTRGAGHLGPLVPLARACARAGHDVLVLAPGSAAPLARRAGLPFRAVGEPSPEARAAAWALVWSRATTPGAEHVVRELFVRFQAGAALPGMLAAVEEWRPDVLVRETLEFASCVAAERLGVPEVQFGIHLSSHWDAGALPFAAPALDELRVAAGLVPDPDARHARRAPLLTLAPASLGEATTHVRRFHDPDAPAPGPRDEPLVYVSFGSEAPETPHFPGLYRAAAEALAALPAQILLTIGDRRDPAALGPLPPSVRVERWVAQSAVMPRAAAMVGHGGSGSTLMALAAGVPLALVPLFADNHGNARRVAKRGAGIALEDGAEGLEDAVRALLDDPRDGRAAAAVADEIRGLPPIDDAIAVLGEIADGRLAA